MSFSHPIPSRLSRPSLLCSHIPIFPARAAAPVPVAAAAAAAAAAGVLALAAPARAQVTYRVDSAGGTVEIFNNSNNATPQDNWVANSFVVTAGGTQINSVSIMAGRTIAAEQVTISLYTGSSLTSPSAGDGLTRIAASTTTATVSTTATAFYTVAFATPIVLPVGQVFYASALIRSVPSSAFVFGSDRGSTGNPAFLGRSFFDVGPTPGGTYNLDNTANATLLGSSHPVVGVVQGAGNLGLRVNATVAAPEPGSNALLGLGVLGLGAAIRKRRK